MQDLIILGVLAVVIIIGVVYTVNHFKGKSGCCESFRIISIDCCIKFRTRRSCHGY